LALAMLSWGPLASATDAPVFVLPVDCEVGKTCVLQSYADQDAGPGARDYRCGSLTYDAHRGTDLRIIDSAMFRRGVPVLAAAAGRVRAVRDGMADVSVRVAGKESIAGREAGNSVVVEHGGGWETQYAHLRRGSVAVKAGDPVEAGQRLGSVGLSGGTEFPHLHFEVRRQGKAVDPFVGVAGAEACSLGRAPLWGKESLAALAYTATGVLDAGISGARPQLVDGSIASVEFTPNAGAAIFWVHIYGVRAGDREELRLIGPDGRVLAEQRNSAERNLAQWLWFAGKRRSVAWPAGTYVGEFNLYRGEEKLLSVRRTAVMK
jgi:hypothetical protein